MNTLVRWGKFNLVGAIGMGVQLASLALFNRVMSGHYLCASAAAIEITLLHNFAWHWHYTWRDHREEVSKTRALMRFHLSNGLVSLVGNTALMRLLVHEAHLRLLGANIIAILCCSLANFSLGNRWTFVGAAEPIPLNAASIPPASSVRLALILLLVFASAADAQTQVTQRTSDVPNAPAPSAPHAPNDPKPELTVSYRSESNNSYYYNVGAFCGAGSSTSSAANKPVTGCGVGFTFVPLPLFVEVGAMAPQANRSYLSGYISLDTSIPLARQASKYLPLAILGYSRLFETGHSLDYGLALALPRFAQKRDDSKSLRIELRDYCTFANPTQHNVMIRVGWMTELRD